MKASIALLLICIACFLFYELLIGHGATLASRLIAYGTSPSATQPTPKVDTQITTPNSTGLTKSQKLANLQ